MSFQYDEKYTLLLDCLKNTFCYTDQITRKQSEEKLKELSEDSVNHFLMILTCLKNDADITNELKLSIILHMKRVLKAQMKKASLKDDEIKVILENFLDTLMNGNFSETCFSNLNSCFQDLLNYNTFNQNPVLIDNILDYLKNQSVSIKYINTWKPLLQLIDKIMQSGNINSSNYVTLTEKIFYISDQIYSNCMELISKLEVNNPNYHLVLSDFFNQDLEIIKNKNENYAQLNLSYKVLFFCFDILKIYTNFLYQCALKFKIRMNLSKEVYDLFNCKYLKVIMQIFQMNKTSDYTFGIFSWEFIDGLDKNSDYFFSELDSKINSVKNNCIIFVNNLFNKSKKEMKFQDNISIIYDLLKIGLDFFEFIVNNRLKYFKDFSVSLNLNHGNSRISSHYYESLIFQYLTLFANVVKMKPFKDDLRFDPKTFTKSYILPFMLFTNQEESDIKYEGENFSEYLNNIIVDNRDKSIKVVCSKILKLHSKFDKGYTKEIAKYCLETLDVCFKNASGFTNDSFSGYEYIKPVDNIFIKLGSFNEIVDISILVLSILNEPILNSNTLMKILSKFLNENIYLILKIENPIIITRICYFIVFFLESVFSQDSDVYRTCIEYLMNGIFLYNKKLEGISYVCATSLNDLLNGTNINVENSRLVFSYMEKFLKLIPNVDIIIFYSVIEFLIKNNDLDNELSIRLLKALVDKVNNLTDLTKEESNEGINSHLDESTKSTLIVKIFNSIRALFNSEKRIQLYKIPYIQIISPLLKLIKFSEAIKFDEDLVIIVTSYLKFGGEITNEIIEFFKDIDAYIKKNEGISLDSFEFLNMFILNSICKISKDNLMDQTHYENNEFSLLKNHYSQILNYLLKMLKQGYSDKAEKRMSHFLSYNLLCIILQNCDYIEPDLVKNIIIKFIKRLSVLFQTYKDQRSEFLDSMHFYELLSILSIIYSGFIYYGDSTMDAFIANCSFNLIKQITNKFIEESSKYPSYFLKIINIGLSSLINNERMKSEIPDLVQEYLNILVYSLSQEKINESKRLKKLNLQEIKNSFLKMDQNYTDSESENEEQFSPIKEKEEDQNNLIIKINKKDLEDFENEIDTEKEKTDELHWEIQETIYRIKNPVSDYDEYDVFRNMIVNLKQNNPDLYNTWFDSLNEKDRKIFQTICSTSIVKLNHENIINSVPRKIVKIRRMDNN